LLKPVVLGVSEGDHVFPSFCSTDDGADSDDKNIDEFVAPVRSTQGSGKPDKHSTRVGR
jgi:hypothetical protein